jgi:molecular chaperone GrpE
MTKTNAEKELERRENNNHKDSHSHKHQHHEGCCHEKHKDEENLKEKDKQECSLKEGEVEALKKQLEAKDIAIKEMEEKIKLVAAEFLNSKNRLEKELQSTKDFAVSKFALSLIKILEEIELSLSHFSSEKLSQNEKLMFEGILMTKSNILSSLESFSITPMSINKGDKFDYNLHQAVSTIEAEGEKGTIFAVLSKGYLIASRVLKPAIVSVIK